MNNNKLVVLFYIQKNRTNSKGLCPLRIRITYSSQRKEFSNGIFINPKKWNSKLQKMKSTDKDCNYVNNQLSLIKSKINQAFLYLQMNEKQFDVEDIYIQYSGDHTRKIKYLLEVFDIHNQRFLKLVGKEYSKSTYIKLKEARKHTYEFIKFKFNKNDILLESIKLNFIDDFDFYLKTEKNHKQITINKTIQRLKKIIKLALGEGYLSRDPFILYHPKRVEKKIVYLTKEELTELENHKFIQKRIQQVADMFIFCCYTGLAYNEMASLESSHIHKGFDGNDWIKMTRKKTKREISIPLLAKSKEILAKYQESENLKLLPIISNQKFNSYLKEISDVVGFEKNLTHHVARKTFATTILLYNDIPMEIVSELLGHSKISTTQESYAKVVQSKVSEHIKELNTKLTSEK